MILRHTKIISALNSAGILRSEIRLFLRIIPEDLVSTEPLQLPLKLASK